jgi:hypothetical protein
MNIPDFKVPRTKIPIIPQGTKYRCPGWGNSDLNKKMDSPHSNFISYGYKNYDYEVYILCESPNYYFDSYYMIKESDIIKLCKEQNKDKYN